MPNLSKLKEFNFDPQALPNMHFVLKLIFNKGILILTWSGVRAKHGSFGYCLINEGQILGESLALHAASMTS